MLTYNDLAKRYGVTKMTIHRWRENGWLPSPLQLGPGTVRFREQDIAKFERFVAERGDADDPDSVPRPNYSLPEITDVFALSRERLASMGDPESTAETMTERIGRLGDEISEIAKQSAILASMSTPGQLSKRGINILRANITDEVAETLCDALPDRRADRLRAILAGEN